MGLLLAGVLSVAVKRFCDLLPAQVLAERERTNLLGYFSPNMIQELSASDDPLRDIREQNLAVPFVDAVRFTAYASRRSPEVAVHTLREIHFRRPNVR